MKIRIFGFSGNQVNKAERWLHNAVKAHPEIDSNEWIFVGVFEMLEVARKQIPSDGIGIEANGGMIYRGDINEEIAQKVINHILSQLSRQK